MKNKPTSNGTMPWMLNRKLAYPMNLIDWQNPALSAIKLPVGWNIVRPMSDGQFAVIHVREGVLKLVKVLPTLERARAYNFAISTN